jgi:hypothetical protein
MPDLRRPQRFPVHFHGVLSGPKLDELAGTILNLSERGCLIATTSQVYAGIQVTLRIDIPDEASPIHIEQAAVRWNRHGQLGVGFIALAGPHQERLDQLLKRICQEPKR